MAAKLLVEYLHDRQLVRLTLNAPKPNVLDSQMMSELEAALQNLHDEPQVKLVQLIGSGDHFSFGASVQEHVREQAPAMLKRFHGLFYALMDLAIPTAALISGQCLGGGLELALMCHFMFVDSSAVLGQPEIQLGVFPPPASVILPMKVGQTRADDLVLTGRSIKADEALSMGLVNQIYESHDDMIEGVDKWFGKQLLPKSASSLKLAVRAARMSFHETLREQLAAVEALYLDELMTTHDANEGILSFLERRKPIWQNK